MKRLRVMQFLCCLSLMLCVTCSEAFSIKASAAEVSPDASHEWFLLPFNYFDDYGVQGNFNSVSGTYDSSGAGGNDNYLNFSVNVNSSGVFPQFYAGHTYLIYSTISLQSSSVFSINRASIRYTWGESGNGLTIPLNNFIINSSRYVNNTTTVTSVFTVSPTKDHSLSTASQFVFVLSNSVSHSGRASWAFYALDVTDNTQQQIDSIITAIQNQTSQLGSAIGGAADQVTDKIDEVLTPEGSHNFDEVIGDVNDKINENMGALGFAHDTVSQFADLFTETPGAPVITVPPLKMSIKGQEYEFFHGYQYDFRSLETGPLAILVAAVRTAGTIVLWLAFLSYCSKEFNNFFRR